MATGVRGIGSELGGVLLVALGVAGFFLAPADVARLLTLVVIGFGLRDLLAPKDGRAPSLLVLVVGIWLAIVAYGIWRLDVLSALPLLVALVGLALVFQGILDGRRAAPSQWEGKP